MSLILTLFILLIPLLVSGILHMVIVKIDLLPQLKIPISTQLFGKNKTWRGVLIMPILTILGLWLAVLVDKEISHNFLRDIDILTGGLILGLLYIIGELPNSYWKRKKGISEGKLPTGKMKAIHIIVDQGDSAISCALGYYLLVPDVNLILGLTIIVVGTVVHLIFNNLLFWLGVRKEPF